MLSIDYCQLTVVHKFAGLPWTAFSRAIVDAGSSAMCLPQLGQGPILFNLTLA
jgi:hypothetical protein